jgi:hypothetical protein
MNWRPEVRPFIERARTTNVYRDAVDHAAGLAAPPDLGVREELRTALFAFDCALALRDWPAVAEGAAMVENAVKRLESEAPA